MKAEKAKVGMVCESKVNTLGFTYKIVKKKKTVCWVDAYDHDGKPTGYTYKGVSYRILEPIK